MILMDHVFLVFPNGVKALQDINLHVAKDEFMFLVGPTGSGKSSLLKLLYREATPNQGKVLVDKVDVGKLSAKQVPFLRRNVGVIFQDYKLLKQRTIYENVAFALQVTGAPRMQIRRQVMQVLDIVGLTDKASHLPQELSGGQQQKACIARAIINSPQILLADEPTGNLDPDTSWEIVQLLNKINTRHTTVIVATHEKELVNTLRKRVASMVNGRIVRDQKLGVYANGR
ncbi:MAG: cell division ATP-binding protein FtsE [Candidatus Margulisbacteria bacterium]|nr:cell division ATP-binding protein FtsE [Candidatus Margulisiibacteriota bacterium]